MGYEKLLLEAYHLDVDVYETSLKGRIKGLYGDNVILINKTLPTLSDKYCILAEELGHHHKTAGNILDQTDISNRKQEQVARTWAYERVLPLHKIVQAHKESVNGRFEFAEFLGVTEEFLEAALRRYTEKFGISVNYKNYTIFFEPLGVIEWFGDSFRP